MMKTLKIVPKGAVLTELCELVDGTATEYQYYEGAKEDCAFIRKDSAADDDPTCILVHKEGLIVAFVRHNNQALPNEPCARIWKFAAAFPIVTVIETAPVNQ